MEVLVWYLEAVRVGMRKNRLGLTLARWNGFRFKDLLNLKTSVLNCKGDCVLPDGTDLQPGYPPGFKVPA